MYRSCIFIVALICMCSVVLGMQHEGIVQLREPKCQIPILYINNYIVNVSSAYKGLKKEILLTNHFSKSITYERMSRRVKKDISMSRWDNFPAMCSYIKHSRPAQYPNFIILHAVCTESSQNERFNIKIYEFPCVYYTDRGEFGWRQCPEKESKNWGDKANRWLVEVIEIVIQEMIDKRRKGIRGVELYYPNRISDWLTVEKKF